MKNRESSQFSKQDIIAFERIYASVLKPVCFFFSKKLMQQELQYDKVNNELKSLNNVYEVRCISMITFFQ